MTSDIAPNLDNVPHKEACLEIAIRARAQVEVQLCSRHLLGMDRDHAMKTKYYLDHLIALLNNSDKAAAQAQEETARDRRRS